jgi:hypothetical protein
MRAAHFGSVPMQRDQCYRHAAQDRDRLQCTRMFSNRARTMGSQT